MEIPGISPLSGQPTLTNPLNQESLLQGRVTPAQSDSEAQNTVTASDRAPTSISSADVVEQTNEAQETGNEAQERGFNPENPGGTIDFTA
ncbi:MAG: hypothetical protein ACI9FO_000723 [Methylophagaceae bacterium]|jgi:hypothetical protein